MKESYEKITPDTSIIIEGVLSKELEKKNIKFDEIIIHNAVLDELEHQANQNKATGHIGLDELERLRKLSAKYNFEIKYMGDKLKAVEIKYASLGEIDSKIRDLAYNEGCTLITADKVQARVAQAKGINVVLKKIEYTKKKLKLETFFDKTTMSVHLRENVPPYAKKGKPGEWKFEQIREKKMTTEEVKEISREIIESTGFMKNSFIEIERPGSTIVQMDRYRIVITKPPFSDGWEITAVRPVKILNIDDYEMSDKVRRRLEKQAEGILIAGAPGHGKSTFAQALAEHYAGKEKVVKTVEAPRDLQLSDNITQYAISHGSPQEIHDILLLSRPDYTIFDEMRNTEDFALFSDMRLAGVGMVGIVHATNAIDAIQRFIGRIDLGVIPHVIDTVIFIRNGKIDRVLEVKMTVKVPAGMTEADLARPVVEVSNFDSGEAEFEIYSYGEETVVIPIQEAKQGKKSPAMKLAEERIAQLMGKYVKEFDVEVTSEGSATIRVPEKQVPKIIGSGGKRINQIEEEIGIHINIDVLAGKTRQKTSARREEQDEEIDFMVNESKKKLDFYVSEDYAGQKAKIFIDGNHYSNEKISSKGVISFSKKSGHSKKIMNAVKKTKRIQIFV